MFSERKYTYFCFSAEGDLRYTNISRRGFALRGFFGPRDLDFQKFWRPDFAKIDFSDLQILRTEKPAKAKTSSGILSKFGLG